ncbi:hypothetical protein [Paenibacillus humicola]|uniref:hypothetical protein n=1 Tax=Paenibacillus humicola TaxID=3110540 RepID=UPI00237B1B41|nr:hypothetical protein [Paenibacillus humicola]
MDFSQALARFIGRRVEVFQMSQVVTGVLSGVSQGFFTVQVSPSAYTPGTQVSVLEVNTEYVRFLPA